MTNWKDELIKAIIAALLPSILVGLGRIPRWVKFKWAHWLYRGHLFSLKPIDLFFGFV
jgi:hypothetical protein